VVALLTRRINDLTEHPKGTSTTTAVVVCSCSLDGVAGCRNISRKDITRYRQLMRSSACR
jgi:hypothetical protein